MLQALAKSIISLLLIAILGISIIEIYLHYTVAQGVNFELISYTYKSSAGTDSIYPGSRNVELNVNIKYISSDDISISAACLQLPSGITPSRGASQCSPPYSLDNTIINIVKQYDVIVFRYRLDIGLDVTLGSHSITMIIYYHKIDNGLTLTETVEGINILVEPYPELSIDVVDWYWSPEAYPGSQNVYLYIVLRNSGNAIILQADGITNLQYNIFTPNNIRFRVPTLNKHATATVSLGPISINPNAIPDILYTARLTLYATMSTDDNIVYNSSTTKTIGITLSSAPPVNLEILDYGFESVRVVEETIQTRFYVTVINKDFKTIRSMIAYFTILTPEASFINKTKNAVNTYNRILNYGDIATLYSPPLIIGAIDRVNIELRLIIFGDDNGAEFWYENKYYFTVSIDKPHVNLMVADVYWIDGEVYPGSENTRLAIVLENYDVVDVRDLVATLELPINFYPRTIKLTGINIARGSRNTVVFSPISIGNEVEPGVYKVKLNVSGISVADVNTFYRFQNSYILIITVATPPNKTILNVIEYGWLSRRVYINSIGSRLYIYFMVIEPGYTIHNPTLTVYLPKQMIFQSLNRSLTTVVSGVFRYGQAIYVEVPDIDIIAYSEGVYPVVLRLKALCIGSQSFWYDRTYTLLLPIHNPKLNMTLIDKGWRYGIVSPKTSGATAYLTLQSFNIDTIETLVIQLEFDGVNAKFIDGRNRSIATITSYINYGNTFTVTFTDIEVNKTDSKIIANVLITSIIQSSGMRYIARESYVLELDLLPELKVFVIGAVHTQYSGTYAPLLPSARNILINVDLINTKPYSIAWIRPKAYYTPHTVKVNDVTGTCPYGVTAAGTCTLTLNIDVEPLSQPYNYSIIMEIEYGIWSGDAIAIYSDTLEIPIAVASYKYYRPIVRLTTWYWGIQTPIRALEGQRNVPLTLVVINNGPYPVSGVEIEIEPRNNGITLINRRAVCTPILNVGGSCSATLYADLLNVSIGIVGFHVNINYIFTLYGANINDSIGYDIDLQIDGSASGKGLEVIDWGWTNNWPTYPHTENATYFITVVNRWPYRVSGVKLILNLPKGFSSKGEDKAISYIPGPIGSLQQFTATFQISVDGIKPGRYNATLVIEYVVESGTPNTAVTERHPVNILVNDLNNSVTIVSVQWIGAMPEPGTYGTVLAVTIRNNYNPLVKGAVLELYLPKGFTYSATNQSYAKVPATTINLIEYSRISPASYQQLIMNYVSQMFQQGGMEQSFRHGDLFYFYIKLNVLVDRPGTYSATAYLNFIDHWSCIRRIPLEIDIVVIGSTKIIDIYTPIKIKVSNGTSLLNMGIKNIGSSPLYNVYIYLIPHTSMLLPDGNVKYIDVLPSNDVVYISYTLIYNPIAVTMGAAQTYMRYMSVPFGVTIVYRDVSGFMQYLNTSISVLLEPFIDLRLEDVRAVISGDILRVSGVVVNYGIATARSVEAKINIDGNLTTTLIGDIDPASQSVFRIEARVKEVPDTIMLYIVYRDEYYVENVLERKLYVAIEAPTATYTQPQTQSLQSAHIFVIIAVSLFLLAMAFVFYKYMKRVALQQLAYKG